MPYRPAEAITLALDAVSTDESGDASRLRGTTVAFTSINWKYLPKALVLAQSIKEFHREWQFHILLNDYLPTKDIAFPDVDAIVPVTSAGIDKFHSWCFSHDVVELCTGTKSFYFRTLFEKGCDHVYYFDPDIEVLSNLGFLEEQLSDCSVLLTPHSFVEAGRDVEILFTEMSVLAHGLYNLGFLGVRNDTVGRAVIDFWCRRMERYCYDDHSRGLFTDQKWFNLVPLYFDRVRILRHRGCNTASWNLVDQSVVRRDDTLYVGEEPILFFHFSGYDAAVPRRMFEVFGAFNSHVGDLIDSYDAKVAKWAACPESQFPWVYSSFDDGSFITKSVRRFYRSRLENRLVFPNPFFTEARPSFCKAVKAIGGATLESEFDPPGMLRKYF